MIVNRKLAEHFWPNQSPIGKRMRIGTPEMQTPWMTIVGEVADVKLSSPDDPTKEQFYILWTRWRRRLVRSPANRSERQRWHTSPCVRHCRRSRWKNALRTTVRSIDPQLPLTQVQTMEQERLGYRSSAPLQHRAHHQLSRCRGTAGGARHLQRHCLLGRLTRAGDGHPHGARLATRRHHPADSGIRSKACRDRLRRWIAGSGGQPPACCARSCSESAPSIRSC